MHVPCWAGAPGRAAVVRGAERAREHWAHPLASSGVRRLNCPPRGGRLQLAPRGPGSSRSTDSIRRPQPPFPGRELCWGGSSIYRKAVPDGRESRRAVGGADDYEAAAGSLLGGGVDARVAGASGILGLERIVATRDNPEVVGGAGTAAGRVAVRAAARPRTAHPASWKLFHSEADGDHDRGRARRGSAAGIRAPARPTLAHVPCCRISRPLSNAGPRVWVAAAGATRSVWGGSAGSGDLTEVPRDSPTLSAASEALIMQWVASHKYRLISGDIKTVFLSGDEDIRNIFISPPDDVRQMLNLDHETVLRLRKSGVRIGKCAKEMVGQTQDIADQTWIHKLCSRSMCICSS